MTPGVSATATKPTNVRWLVFALGCGTSLTLYLHRYALALIKPELQDRYCWSTTDLGLLDSIFYINYSVFQIPGGFLADRWGAHLFLGGSILIWSLALGLIVVAPGNRLWVQCTRGLFGLGQAGVFAALSRVTRQWFPYSVRTSVQGWVGVFSGRIGGATGYILFATVLMGLLLFTWQQATLLFAAGGVLLAVAFLLLFRDAPRHHPWVNEAEAELIAGKDAAQSSDDPSKPPHLSVRDLFRRMSPRSIANLLAINVQSLLSTVADNIYSAWIPLFLVQVHRLEYKEMGIYSTLPLLGGALGGVVGGMLNDWLIRRTGNPRWSRSGVALVGKGLAAVLFIYGLLVLYDNPYAFCGMLFFVKFFGDWSLSTMWGTITDISGRVSATVFAFNNSFASVALILAPALFGYLAQHFGWPAVFTVVAGTYVLCALSWLLVNCTIPLLAE
ncbi:MAG: MFS transporter [Gemmataceae bacterium]